MAFSDKLGRFLGGAMEGFERGLDIRQTMNREKRAQQAQQRQVGLDEERRIQETAQYDPGLANTLLGQSTNIGEQARTALGSQIEGRENLLTQTAVDDTAAITGLQGSDLVGLDTMEEVAALETRLGASQVTAKKALGTLRSTASPEVVASLTDEQKLSGLAGATEAERVRIRQLGASLQASKDKVAAFKTALFEYTNIDRITGVKPGQDSEENFARIEDMLKSAAIALAGNEEEGMALFSSQKRNRVEADTLFIKSALNEAKTLYGGDLDADQMKELIETTLGPVFRRNPGLLMANDYVIKGAMNAEAKEQVKGYLDLARVTNVAGAMDTDAVQSYMESMRPYFVNELKVSDEDFTKAIDGAMRLSKMKVTRTRLELTALIQNAQAADAQNYAAIEAGNSPALSNLFNAVGLSDIAEKFTSGNRSPLTIEDATRFLNRGAATEGITPAVTPEAPRTFEDYVAKAWNTATNFGSNVDLINNATEGQALEVRNTLLAIHKKLYNEVNFPKGDKTSQLESQEQLDAFNRKINSEGFYYDDKTQKFFPLDDNMKQRRLNGEIITGDNAKAETPADSIADIRAQAYPDVNDITGTFMPGVIEPQVD
mgnify:CR=1 FL=1